MSEIAKYDAYKKKLQGVCDENDLVYRFCCDKYPITLTIRPVTGFATQLSMLENVEEGGYTSPDASIVFTFKDGVLGYKMDKRFTIGDALFSKIKNLFKNMHYTWLQFFYRDIIERGLIPAMNMPVIDDDAMSNADELFPDAEPIEQFEKNESCENYENCEEVLEGDDGQVPDQALPVDDAEVTEAARIVRFANSATASLLQRHMRIGYAKAARLIDALESGSVIGPYNGSKPREVLPYDVPDDPNDEEGSDDDEA